MRPGHSDERVTCIACGSDLPRDEAREYDKFGDRWDREDKSFEYVCKPCFSELCKRPRLDLEVTLDRAGAGHVSTREFLTRFMESAERADRDAE